MITPSSPLILEAFCYAMACRRRREWRLILRSAPVYGCGGSCGTTREIHEIGHPRRPETAAMLAWRPHYGSALTEKEERNSRRWARKAGAAVPSCGCCGLECAVVAGSPVLRCKCALSSRCLCGRGACHCRCNRPAQVQP